MDDIKQNGKDLAKLSIQRRAEENPTAGIYSWWFSRADDGLTISPWWSEQRDMELREFWRREGNDILQGAVSSMVKKFKAMSWVVEGPNRIANKFQALLSEAEFGAGWGVLLGKTLEDYHTQDKGAFWELIGQGNSDGAMTGPVLGVAHLDAQFCQLTGDPIYPVLFNNSKDQKPHKLHATRVVHLVDMPSPNEIMNGIGFCAVSRVIASSQVLLKLAQYKNEKLSDLPEAGLLLLNNILPHQFEDAQANHQRGRRKLGQEIWSNIMTLFSLDPSQPASAELVSFANLPEAFNELESTNIYVNIVALAFGVDVREFWPMTQGALGSARESEVMAQKAKGKGIGDVISTLERAVNWRILPDSVNFRFDFQDDEEDKLKAEINEIKTRTIMSMLQARSNDPNYSEPPVTRLEVRQMLANNVPEYFKEEFLEVESEETEVTDTEREDKANRVSIDSKGKVKSFRRLKHRTEDVLAMAEKNYRDGRIGLDDLLEFRLGMRIDDKAYPGHAGRPGKVGGSAPRGGGAGPVPSGLSETGEIQHFGIPKRMVNELDGGIGPSIQYHGTSNQDYTFGSGSDVYLTPQVGEAEGYARDYHRFGTEPPPGKKNREILGVRRKPGPALGIDDEVTQAIDEGDDIDTVITQMGDVARKNNFRYLYFTHPSFSGNDVQDVVISLYPKEDLKIVSKKKVKAYSLSEIFEDMKAILNDRGNI